MTKLNETLRTLAKQVGGSYKTTHDRIRIVSRFVSHLRALNIQIRNIEHLKAKHIESYISGRIQQGINRRTLQNEMAALRTVLKKSGREKLALSERISNRSLNIGGASRAGTKIAISETKYQSMIQTAMLKDRGLAAALQLARVLGLRSQEAVQSVQSLQTWQTALNKDEQRLTIVFGTKGGRPRETIIIDRELVKKAVNSAIEIAQSRNGKLIDKPDLKSAMTYWRNHTTALGLTGKNSPHSLRYAWAQDALKHYQVQGFSKQEARALTSMDLGHGDGRGRYVERVYGNSEK